MRVFDPSKNDGDAIQKNIGHTGEIKSIIHLPTRNQVYLHVLF